MYNFLSFPIITFNKNIFVCKADFRITDVFCLSVCLCPSAKVWWKLIKWWWRDYDYDDDYDDDNDDDNDDDYDDDYDDDEEYEDEDDDDNDNED